MKPSPLRRFGAIALTGSLFAVAAQAEFRTWTSSDGKSIVADLRSATATEVRLILKDGRLYTLPIDRLSEADRTHVKGVLDGQAADAKEKARLNGGKEGPFAGKVTGQWTPLTSDEGLPFLLFGPATAMADKKGKLPEALPLVVYLHGAGARGTDNAKQKEPGADVFSKPANQTAHPCFIVTPQCPEEKFWGSYTDQILALVHRVADNLPIDRDRIYIHGFSMGGHGSYSCIEKEPALFAAALPCAGGGNPSKVSTYKAVPVWAFAGEKDDAGVVNGAVKTMEALTAAGGFGKSTVYPNEGHLIHVKVAEDANVRDWMFAQKRGTPPTPPKSN